MNMLKQIPAAGYASAFCLHVSEGGVLFVSASQSSLLKTIAGIESVREKWGPVFKSI